MRGGQWAYSYTAQFIPDSMWKRRDGLGWEAAPSSSLICGSCLAGRIYPEPTLAAAPLVTVRRQLWVHTALGPVKGWGTGRPADPLTQASLKSLSPNWDW